VSVTEDSVNRANGNDEYWRWLGAARPEEALGSVDDEFGHA
jgi:hypothetical protein